MKCPLPPVARSSSASPTTASERRERAASAIARRDGVPGSMSTRHDRDPGADRDDAADVGAELAGADEDRRDEPGDRDDRRRAARAPGPAPNGAARARSPRGA